MARNKRVTPENVVAEINKILYQNGIHVKIHGCGCLGSPWIDDEEGNELANEVVINSIHEPIATKGTH